MSKRILRQTKTQDKKIFALKREDFARERAGMIFEKKVLERRARRSAHTLPRIIFTDDESDDEPEVEEDCAAEKCLRPTGVEVDWVQCDGGCQKWFHLHCVGLRKGDINDNDDYFCKHCTGINTDGGLHSRSLGPCFPRHLGLQILSFAATVLDRVVWKDNETSLPVPTFPRESGVELLSFASSVLEHANWEELEIPNPPISVKVAENDDRNDENEVINVEDDEDEDVDVEIIDVEDEESDYVNVEVEVIIDEDEDEDVNVVDIEDEGLDNLYSAANLLRSVENDGPENKNDMYKDIDPDELQGLELLAYASYLVDRDNRPTTVLGKIL